MGFKAKQKGKGKGGGGGQGGKGKGGGGGQGGKGKGGGAQFEEWVEGLVIVEEAGAEGHGQPDVRLQVESLTKELALMGKALVKSQEESSKSLAASKEEFSKSLATSAASMEKHLSTSKILSKVHLSVLAGEIIAWIAGGVQSQASQNRPVASTKPYLYFVTSARTPQFVNLAGIPSGDFLSSVARVLQARHSASHY